jgi:predicted phage terminase large subunit-like protein
MIHSQQKKHEDWQILGARDWVKDKLFRKAKRSLRAFVRATKPNYSFSWHNRLICQEVQKWVESPVPYILVIEAPPRYGKTEIASKRAPAFILGKYPDAQIIAGSYGQKLASKNCYEIADIISLPKYSEIFPKTKIRRSDSTTIRIDGYEGEYNCSGVTGTATGMGANFFIVDDPIKNHKEADSEVYRDSVWDWFQSVVTTRLEKNGRIMIILTRWHEDDLVGRLVSSSKENARAMRVITLKLPAIKEGTPDEHPDDPRMPGDPLWPGKYPLERLETIKASLHPRWWNSLFQQRPSALEGGIIKSSWIQYWKELPPRFDLMIQSWDTSFKDTKNSDFVAGTVWGKHGKNVYMMPYLVNERLGFVAACDAFLETTRIYPMAHKKIVEETANGVGLIEVMRSKVPGVVGYKPTDSKKARLEAVSTWIKAGDVKFPHPSIFPDVSMVVDQLVKFPNAAHDDIVDSVSQALLNIFGSGSFLQRISKL